MECILLFIESGDMIRCRELLIVLARETRETLGYPVYKIQTCRLRYFYAHFIAEVGADWPFLKAL